MFIFYFYHLELIVYQKLGEMFWGGYRLFEHEFWGNFYRTAGHSDYSLSLGRSVEKYGAQLVDWLGKPRGSLLHANLMSLLRGSFPQERRIKLF